MKRWISLVVLVFCCWGFSAEGPQKVETLSSKVILKNKEGYFVLSDGSCWKAIGFSKRSRSIKEWWNSVQLAVPKNYECTPNDWFIGACIEVYSKNDNAEVSEDNASNQEALRQCTNVLVNSSTKQVLFAIALVFCVNYLFRSATIIFAG